MLNRFNIVKNNGDIMSIQYLGFSHVCRNATTKARDIEKLKRVFVMCKVKDMMNVYFDQAYDYVSNKKNSITTNDRLS